MNPRLVEIDRLIQSRQYGQARDLLERIDEPSLASSDKGYFLILLSEALFSTGTYEHGYIDRAVEAFRSSSDTALFARAKYVKGWGLSLIGEYPEAKQHLLEAYAGFLRCQDAHGTARALNRLSYVALKCGDNESAISSLRYCLNVFAERGDSISHVKVAHNLANVLWICGKLTESVTLFASHAISDSTKARKAWLLQYIMSAIPHALLGDTRTARTTIARASPFLDDYPREKAIYFENLGLINILDADYEAAEEALGQGLTISLEIAPESALISQIKRLFGDVYVGTHQWEKAEQFGREALQVAKKIGERIEIAACHRVFAQTAQHRGQDGKAREWYEKATDVFHLIGARYELAVTRYLAGVSGLYTDGERHAHLYLARKYFESEQVRHYIAKIDTALKTGVTSLRSPAVENGDSGGCPTMIVRDHEMAKLLEFARHVAQSEMTVLLTGETGTGKDLLARHIHHWSGRQGEFVSVNAAAIPSEMIEAELFGYCKGAFTGAGVDRPGLLEQAAGGTFYLNEIADATPEFQAKLLEVLETRQVRRLGENQPRRLTFRLIAATNHDVELALREGRFRPDLYHRLNQIPIHLPPLRERREDVPALVAHFLKQHGYDGSRDDHAAVEQLSLRLSQHSWPGNVRELESAVRRLWLRTHGDLACMAQLAAEENATTELDSVMAALVECGGNQRQAARRLGISEGTVRYRLRKRGE